MQAVQRIGDIMQEITKHLSNVDISQLSMCSRILNKYLRFNNEVKTELPPQLGRMHLRTIQLQLSDKILNMPKCFTVINTPVSFGKTLLGLHIALTHPGKWLIICASAKALANWHEEYYKCFQSASTDKHKVLFLHSMYKRDYVKARKDLNAKVIITTKNAYILHWFQDIHDIKNVINDDYKFPLYCTARKFIILSSGTININNVIAVHSEYVKSCLPSVQLQHFHDQDVASIVAANFHTVIYLGKTQIKKFSENLSDHTVFKHNDNLTQKQKFEACTGRAVLLIEYINAEFININADALIIINANRLASRVLEMLINRVQRTSTTAKTINVYLDTSSKCKRLIAY